MASNDRRLAPLAVGVAIISFCILLGFPPRARAVELDAANTHDIALFLAGLEPARISDLYRLTQNEAWRDYAVRIGRKWDRFETQTLAKVRAFAADSGIGLRSTVFYPFGGPDLAFALTFYPEASTYVLCGLESAATLSPSLDDQTLIGLVPRLRSTMLTYLDQGFFQTDAMRSERSFAGVAPLLMIAAVRAGARVEAIDAVHLASGEIREGADDGGGTPGLRMRITVRGNAKSVYYFRVNLADRSLDGSSFARLVERLSPFVSLVKGASYLPHEPDFSMISRLLLDHSMALVQDDTGVPFERFASGGWRVRLFGRYRSPRGAFGKYHQRMLAARAAASFEPLPFDLGYDTRHGRSHLMVALKVGPVSR